MFPQLIDFGTLQLPLFGEVHPILPTYGVAFAIAVALAWSWFDRRAKSLGVAEEQRFNLMFYALLAGLLGAKLLLLVVDWRYYLIEHPSEIPTVLRSGGVLMGGVLLGALTFSLYSVKRALPFWRLLDAMAGPLILAQAVGRLGCFAAGCCWGRLAPHGSAFAVTYTSHAAHDHTGIPLHEPLYAVQLIESGIDLMLLIPLTWMWRRQLRPAGTTWWSYVLLYGVARFGLEFLRGDLHRGVYFGGTVSTSQLLSIGAAATAALLLVRGRLRRGDGPSAPLGEAPAERPEHG